MEGKLERIRGLFGRRTLYWFRINPRYGTLSYAKNKDNIENPMKTVHLLFGTVNQESRTIRVSTLREGMWVLQAKTEEDALRWTSSIRSVIEAFKTKEPVTPELSVPVLPALNQQVPQLKKDFYRLSANDNHPSENPDPLQTKTEEAKTKLFVVAIDFGTTYSGFAYQFIEDFKRDRFGGKTELWNAGTFLAEKTPTCLLATKGGKFDSFGYDAETKYMQLLENDEGKGWRYFKQFKMKLFTNEGLSRDFLISDEQGNSMQARTVFGFAIEYLKNRAFNTIEKSMPGVSEENIFYVVTIPAIWNEKCRQFMIEAFNEAGIDLDQAILSKEPEAAAIYCKERQLGLQKAHKKHKAKKSGFKFESGSKFIVLDLGGGTTDIAVNEVTEDKRLRMIRSASGGPWGGTNIDQEFLSLISELTGGYLTFGELIKNHREEFMELMKTWEIKKRQISGSGEDEKMQLSISLPYSFLPQSKKKGTIETSRGTVRVDGHKLRLSSSIVESLYAKTAKNIAGHLHEIREDLKDVSTVFLVGGLSESLNIQIAIKKAMPGKTVIIPHSPLTAVLRGALIYGFCPELIARRISSLHYGIEEDSRFKVLVHKGQEIRIGEKIAEHRVTLMTAGDGINIIIYGSEKQHAPEFVTSCKKVGEIRVRMSTRHGVIAVEMIIAISFEHTEMRVEATDAKTRKMFVSTCDFL